MLAIFPFNNTQGTSHRVHGIFRASWCPLDVGCNNICTLDSHGAALLPFIHNNRNPLVLLVLLSSHLYLIYRKLLLGIMVQPCCWLYIVYRNLLSGILVLLQCQLYITYRNPL